MGGYLSHYCCSCCGEESHQNSRNTSDYPNERTRLLGSSGDVIVDSAYGVGIGDLPSSSFNNLDDNNDDKSVSHAASPHSPKDVVGLEDAEQAELSNILHAAAHELIDVSAMNANGVGGINNGVIGGILESQEYADRAREYRRRLASAAPALAAKYNAHNWPPPLLHRPPPPLVVSGQQERLLAADTITDQDIKLISVIAAKAKEAVHGEKFNSVSQRALIRDLVVPFGE